MVPPLVLVVLILGTTHGVCSKHEFQGESSEVLTVSCVEARVSDKTVLAAATTYPMLLLPHRRAPLEADACSPAAWKHILADCPFTVSNQEYGVLREAPDSFPDQGQDSLDICGC